MLASSVPRKRPVWRVGPTTALLELDRATTHTYPALTPCSRRPKKRFRLRILTSHATALLIQNYFQPGPTGCYIGGASPEHCHSESESLPDHRPLCRSSVSFSCQLIAHSQTAWVISGLVFPGDVNLGINSVDVAPNDPEASVPLFGGCRLTYKKGTSERNMECRWTGLGQGEYESVLE